MAKRSKRSRKGLGSASTEHNKAATKALTEIAQSAAEVGKQARNDKCQAALMAYADMQQSIGAFDAHMKARRPGGSLMWFPKTVVSEAAGLFNDRCVMAFPDKQRRAALDGRKRRRR